MIQIRQAVYEDIPRIMQFIDEHWKKGHIAGNSRAFFEWQFVEGEDVHVIIAIDENNKIYGMDGYITYNQEKRPDISGCLWKTIKSGRPFLGMEFQNVIDKVIYPVYSLGIGLNQRAQKLELLQGGIVSHMSHYYLLGECQEYRIAIVKNPVSNSYAQHESEFLVLETIQSFKEAISEEQLRSQIPFKDYFYVEHRYFHHFCYQYLFLQLIKEGEKCNCVFVTREVECQGHKILKIVDFYGDEENIACAGKAFDTLIKENEYEYIDFYCYGIGETLLEQAGFVKRTEDDINVIPNYFEPFEQRNIEIAVAGVALKDSRVRLFRGDGDQDRPSEWR